MECLYTVCDRIYLVYQVSHTVVLAGFDSLADLANWHENNYLVSQQHLAVHTAIF